MALHIYIGLKLTCRDAAVSQARGSYALRFSGQLERAALAHHLCVQLVLGLFCLLQAIGPTVQGRQQKGLHAEQVVVPTGVRSYGPMYV